MGKFKSVNISCLFNKITSLGKINSVLWVKLSLLFSSVEALWLYTCPGFEGFQDSKTIRV